VHCVGIASCTQTLTHLRCSYCSCEAARTARCALGRSHATDAADGTWHALHATETERAGWTLRALDRALRRLDAAGLALDGLTINAAIAARTLHTTHRQLNGSRLLEKLTHSTAWH
jgi:hypothetical protein